MKTRVLLSAGIAIALTACGSGISTNTDWNQSVDFTGLNTYMWFDAQSTGINDINSARVRQSVDAALAAKGFSKVSSGGDLAVSYQVTTADRSSFQTVSSGWGGGYRWGAPGWGMSMGTSSTREITYTDGTLVLAMFDGKTKDQVWHGSATTEIDPNRSPEERAESINSAVNKMLEDFPPGS